MAADQFFPQAKMNAFIARLRPNFKVSSMNDDGLSQDWGYLIGPKSYKGKADIWGNYGSHIHIIFQGKPDGGPETRIWRILMTMRPQDMTGTALSKEAPGVASIQMHYYFTHKVDLVTEVDGDADRKTLIKDVNTAADAWLLHFGDLSKAKRPVGESMQKAWTPLGSQAKGPIAQEARMDMANKFHDMLLAIRDALDQEYGNEWALEWDR